MRQWQVRDATTTDVVTVGVETPRRAIAERLSSSARRRVVRTHVGLGRPTTDGR